MINNNHAENIFQKGSKKMDNQKRQEMLATISSLMAKANASKFDHERTAFMKKAQELRVKYNISQFEIEEQQQASNSKSLSTIVVTHKVFPKQRKQGIFIRNKVDAFAEVQLVSAVAEFFDCSVFYSGKKSNKRYGVIGTEEDIFLAMKTALEIAFQLDDMLNDRLDFVEENARRYKNDYVLGAANQLRILLRETKVTDNEVFSEQDLDKSKAIVLKKEYAVRRYEREKLNMRSAQATRRSSSRNGRLDGKNDANNLDIGRKKLT